LKEVFRIKTSKRAEYWERGFQVGEQGIMIKVWTRASFPAKMMVSCPTPREEAMSHPRVKTEDILTVL